jgi:hypothetical protein
MGAPVIPATKEAEGRIEVQAVPRQISKTIPEK